MENRRRGEHDWWMTLLVYVYSLLYYICIMYYTRRPPAMQNTIKNRFFYIINEYIFYYHYIVYLLKHRLIYYIMWCVASRTLQHTFVIITIKKVRLYSPWNADIVFWCFRKKHTHIIIISYKINAFKKYIYYNLPTSSLRRTTSWGVYRRCVYSYTK